MTQVITESMRLSVPPTATKSQRVCRHFARGRCTWGTSCRFSHELDRPASEEISVSSVLIGQQQQQLQKERTAILKLALDGKFEIEPYNGDGSQRYLVRLAHSSSPIPITQLLSESALSKQLLELERSEQLRAGGVLYLVGEPTVFWSMMRFYSLNRTTTNAKWDVLLFNAKHGLVECMFYRTPAGCLSSECTFEHSSIPAVTITPPLQNMTTNNALLTPLLGFGVTATSATPCTTTSASNISSNALTAATPAGGLAPKPFIGGNSLRIPVDTTRHLAAAPVVDKPDDVMMFRDPVWGSCGTQEKRTTQQSQQQQQQQAQQQQNGVTIFWGPGERNLSETFW